MAEQEQNGGRKSLLTEELVEKAKGYLATCEDSYRRFDEIVEDESQREVPGDELYFEARDTVRIEGKGSTSLLQRKLKIGYARAAKLMDLLEEHLVVGPADGPAPRELLLEGDEKDYMYADVESVTRPKRSLYRTGYNSHYRQHVQLPSIAGLAVYLGVSRDSIYEWQGQETELGKRFSDITAEVLAEQERRLVDNGLSGIYNPTIAKLILGKHGYSDKTDVTSGDKPIQVSPEAQAMAKAALDAFLPKPAPGDTPIITAHGNTDTPATPGE